jgi:hypothetical protein
MKIMSDASATVEATTKLESSKHRTCLDAGFQIPELAMPNLAVPTALREAVESGAAQASPLGRWRRFRPRTQAIRMPVFFACTFFAICRTTHEWFAREAWVEEPSLDTPHLPRPGLVTGPMRGVVDFDLFAVRKHP